MDKTQEALIKAVVADYVKEKGKQPSSEKELTTYIKEKGGDKYLQTKLQSLTQKAARGAKLNYIKQLSHKCADDEELFYFKRGGTVDCGCRKKKMEDGGTIKDMPWKAEFKKKQAEKAKAKAEEEKKKAAQRKRDTKFADEYNEGYSHVERNKGVKKNCGGSKFKFVK